MMSESSSSLEKCTVEVHLMKEVTPQDTHQIQPAGTDTQTRSSRKVLAPKRLSYENEPAKPKRGIKRPRSKLKEEDGMHDIDDDADCEEKVHIGLSEYELERLENIRQNQAFLSALNLPQVAETLKPKKTSQLGLKRERVVKEVLPPRKSLRLQNKDAEEVLKPPPDELREETVFHRSLQGPVPMCPLNFEEEDAQLPKSLVKLWIEEPEECKEKLMDLKKYKESLQSLSIDEEGVVKVVKERIFSAAFHPSSSSLLMAAGDKKGQVGLFNLGASWGDNGVALFEPHTRPVNCMAFSTTHPTTLITTSYDGAARAANIERAMFEEVYRMEDGLRSFDFLSHDCSTLLIGDTLGYVAVVDTRTPGTSHESLYHLDPKTLRSVHVHPSQKHYFVVAQYSGVHVYDIRNLKKRSSQAVSTLRGHSRSASYAYFSPDTGNRVLTTCMDDRLRVFDTSQLDSSTPVISTIRHNTQSGRWLSKLQAVWDTQQPNCFVVGCLERPRKIKVFHESGQLAHVFQSEDHMSTVCSIVSFHPNRRALVGGNSSGRLHVFT